jgi:uncharacterized protein involved in exopolysaccharide biosynthesis
MLRPYYRGLPLILLSMILCIVLAKVYLHFATPKYESVVKIKLADAQFGVSHENLYRDFDVFATTSKIGAEVEMLQSQVVIKRALKHLDLGITMYRKGFLHKKELYKDCPFKIVAQPIDKRAYDSTYKLTISTRDSSIILENPSKEKFRGKLNHILSTPYLYLFIKINDSLFKIDPDMEIGGKYEMIINSENALIKQTQDILDVMASDKEVPVLRVAYKCPVAEKCADIVNTISEAYISDYIEEKFTAADTTVTFLNREVSNYTEKLKEAENSLEGFRKDHNVVNLKQETETDLRSLAELKNQLAGLQMQLVAIDSLDAYVKKGKDNFIDLAPNFSTFNDLLSTEIIKKIKSLQSDKRDLLLNYTPQNEKVLIIDKKLNDLFTYLEESIGNTRKDLQFKYNDLVNTIEIVEKKFDSYPYKERNMTVLERNFDLNDQIYRFLQEKKTNAEIARAASISFHRIIARGLIPDEPVSPVPILILVLGGFFGLLLGVLLIYLVHFLKDRVNNETNVYKNCDTNLLTKVPFLKTEDQSKIVFDRTAIELQVQKNLEKGAVVGVTSFIDMEGKMTLALGLAKATALLGKKTALLDCDNKMRQLKVENIDILSLSDLCKSWEQPEKLKAFIKGISAEYDVVIIKNYSLSKKSSALLVMSTASINLFVVDSRRTKLKKLQQVDLMKEEMGIGNIQLVLNRDQYAPSVYSQVKALIKRYKNRKKK